MSSADQVLAVVWRRRLTVLLTTACAFAAVAAVTYTLPKTYSTNAYLVVDTLKPTTSDFTAQQVSQVDTQTTAELLQTRNTAALVAGELPYSDTAKHVQSQVSISPVSQTQLVLITAKESTPLRAQQLANTYAKAFISHTAPTIGFARVALGEPAPLIQDPSAPRPLLYLLIGAVLAILAGVGAGLLRDWLDRSLRIDPFASEVLGLPILARVPEIDGRRGRRRVFAGRHDVPFVEGFRWVFANLAFVSGGERPKTIAVVSAREQEGKSTVCLAMGEAAVETLGGGVLLVDSDLRRPSLEKRVGVSESQGEGLSTHLADPKPGAHRIGELARDVPDSAIRLVSAGPRPPSPASLLGRPTLSLFIRDVCQLYDFVVFDTPPVSAGVDASLIAGQLDGAILVVDARASQRPAVEWSLDQLRRADVNVLGVIVNRVRDTSATAYYYEHPKGDEPVSSDRRKARPARKAEGSGGVDSASEVAAPVPTD